MATWREIRENLFLAFGRGSIFRYHRQHKEEEFNLTLNPDMSLPAVHVFASDFPSKQALLDYCYSPVTPHGPEQINLDLPDAALDTNLIEIAHGDDEIHELLSDYFLIRRLGAVKAGIGPSPGCVLVPREAIQLSDAVLHDTGNLRYVGSKSRSFG